MKKIVTTCIYVFFICNAFAQGDIYKISFSSLDSGQINIGDYISKKIIVVAIDAGNPDYAQLQFLDSLHRDSSNAYVCIGVPVNDFNTPMQANQLLSLLRDSFHIIFPVSLITRGKKGSGQHILMSWITTSSSYNHFDIDLDQAGQVFIISTHGVLYGIFQNLNVSNYFKSALISEPPR